MDDSPPAYSTRRRTKLAAMAESTASPSTPSPAAAQAFPAKLVQARNSPFLPSPLEAALLAVYPLTLLFGSLFSLIDPAVRRAPYDAVAQSHVIKDPSLVPSYFARKDNLLNILFVKRGWAWFTLTFALFVLTHPALRNQRLRTQAAVRWVIVTAWWVVVTQWCFGAPLIDKGFRYTGGGCEVVENKVASGEGDAVDIFTAVACKSTGGRWKGGHDISGHVFMLVLGSAFLAQEVGWVLRRWAARGVAGAREERTVIMQDGAVKSAEVEAQREITLNTTGSDAAGLDIGVKAAAAVIGMSLWMLLMTAIYFHTWFEKFTGLLVSTVWVYTLYILPRWVPALRAFVGMPGI